MSATDILYLSYDGMTDPLGQSQVIPYLSFLSRSGYRFHLVSFEKKERFQEGQDKINNILKAAGIQWYPCLYTKSPPVLSTLKDLLIMKRVAGRIIQENTIMMVHCRSYISALAGLHIKEKFNIPFLFDMRGFWADERVDGKIWSLSNPVFSLIYRYFKKKGDGLPSGISSRNQSDRISKTGNSPLETERYRCRKNYRYSLLCRP